MMRFSALASAAVAALAAGAGAAQEISTAPSGMQPIPSQNATLFIDAGAPATVATPAAPLAPSTAAPLTSFVNGSGNCGSGSCDSKGSGRLCCNDPCNPHFWIYAEYLGWWTKGDTVPPLLGRIPAGATAPTTTFGGEEINDDYRSGVRAGGGLFLGKCRRTGFEVEWMSLGRHNETFSVQSDLNSTLVRPIVPATAGDLPFVVLSAPGRIDAEAFVNHRSALYGGTLGFRRHLNGGGDSCGSGNCGSGNCGGDSCKTCIDLTWGYRYFQLDETLTVGTRQTSPAVADAEVQQLDSFENSNQFHGGYIGFAGEYNCGKWYVGMNGKLAAGYIQQTSVIDGVTNVINNGVVVQQAAGGVLAQPSNMGTRVNNDFAVIPQLGVKVGYQITCRIRSYIGYDILWIDNVLRPGGTVDTTVNVNQGAALAPLRPAFIPQDGEFWAHGVNAGMEIKF